MSVIHRLVQSRIWQTWKCLICALFVACLVRTAAGQDATTIQGSPSLIDKVGIDPHFGQQVPLDLEFVDSTGARTRLGDCLRDRPVILQLVYYQCPMLCKLSSDGLFKAVKAISLQPGKDYSIVTLSFDPREGPDLSARARIMAKDRCGQEAVDHGWRFLTGDQQNISALCHAVGFRYVYDEHSKQFAHATGVFVLTPKGKISRYLSGIDYPPRDLRLAIVEASSGKVGTAIDQVLLMCCLYDPTTGRYGLAIVTALRIGGIVTVGIMGIAIAVMLRRDRKRRKREMDHPLLGREVLNHS